MSVARVSRARRIEKVETLASSRHFITYGCNTQAAGESDDQFVYGLGPWIFTTAVGSLAFQAGRIFPPRVARFLRRWPIANVRLHHFLIIFSPRRYAAAPRRAGSLNDALTRQRSDLLVFLTRARRYLGLSDSLCFFQENLQNLQN